MLCVDLPVLTSRLAKRWLLLAFASTLPLAGCSIGNTVAPTPIYVELPVSDFVSGTVTPSGFATSIPLTCGGLEYETPVIIEAINGHIVGVLDSRSLPIYWPPGFRAVFDPLFLEVLTDTGQVFVRAGDDINKPTGASTYKGRHVCWSESIDFW
jgi:hypothetical protein